MALHKNFPKDKYAILDPEIRWFPVDGTIANYYPDFFIKTNDKTVYIVETKGREDLDDPLKISRLAQWCEDANNRQKKISYQMLYVKQEKWDKYRPKNWSDLVKLFAGTG